MPDVVAAAGSAATSRGMRVGVVKRARRRGLPGRRRAARSREAVALLAKLGAEVVEVDCPHFEYALPAYYLIAPSECSSNLARFDAMRYGLRVGDDGDRAAPRRSWR